MIRRVYRKLLRQERFVSSDDVHQSQMIASDNVGSHDLTNEVQKNIADIKI